MKKFISIILAGLLVLSLAACQSNKGGEAQTDNYDPEGIGSYNLYSGMVTTAGETKIEKNDSYIIDEIKVEVGDSVKKGDVLFTYDVSQVGLDIEKAELELEQLNNTYANLESTKAQLQKEKANASEDMQLEYALEIKETEAEMLETSYSIKMKQQSLEQLKTVFQNGSEKSPVSGKVKSINTDPNNYDQPFMVISESDNLVVMGYVNETNIYEISVGMEVTILSRVDDKSWTGTITKIDTESPQQNTNEGYYGPEEAGGMSTSSKYPFYVELTSSEGLMLGQHVYIGPNQASELIDYGTDEEFFPEDGGMPIEGETFEAETIPEVETEG